MPENRFPMVSWKYLQQTSLNRKDNHICDKTWILQYNPETETTNALENCHVIEIDKGEAELWTR